MALVLAYRDALGYLHCVRCSARWDRSGGNNVMARHVVQGKRCETCGRDILGLATQTSPTPGVEPGAPPTP